jgi:tetratricopeptide (TPR) repeat protein
MSKELNKLIDSRNWRAARKLIRSELKNDPKNHWLLTRLSLTYYEEHDYKKSLQISQKAYAINPKCPLVLWDLAGALDMLGREKDAIKIYRNLIRRGVESIALDECGEGLSRARGLVADCYYRLFLCYQTLGAKKKASPFLQKHLSLRGRGCHSIYSLQQVKRKVA